MNLILARNFKTAYEIARSRGLSLHEWKFVLHAEHMYGYQGIPLLIEPGWEEGRSSERTEEIYAILTRTRLVKEYIHND